MVVVQSGCRWLAFARSAPPLTMNLSAEVVYSHISCWFVPRVLISALVVECGRSRMAASGAFGRRIRPANEDILLLSPSRVNVRMVIIVCLGGPAAALLRRHRSFHFTPIFTFAHDSIESSADADVPMLRQFNCAGVSRRRHHHHNHLRRHRRRRRLFCSTAG